MKYHKEFHIFSILIILSRPMKNNIIWVCIEKWIKSESIKSDSMSISTAIDILFASWHLKLSPKITQLILVFLCLDGHFYHVN